MCSVDGTVGDSETARSKHRTPRVYVAIEML